VSDEIRLDALKTALRIRKRERAPAFSRPAPDYVRFERAPAVKILEVDGFEARANFTTMRGQRRKSTGSSRWNGRNSSNSRPASCPTPPSSNGATDLLKPQLEVARAAMVKALQSLARRRLRHHCRNSGTAWTTPRNW